MSIISTGIVGIIFLVFFGSMTYSFAEESLSWKSEYFVGILDSEKDELVPVTVSTFSKDSLQLTWEKPDVTKNQKITGYEILRKELNSDYQIIDNITNSKKTSYIDMNLSEGYYGYKVISILEKIELNKITNNRIDRHDEFFSTYVKGQQLLAQHTLEQSCIRCFDESFEEIDNIFAYEFLNDDKRSKQNHQFNMELEMLKAIQLFDILFDEKNNH